MGDAIIETIEGLAGSPWIYLAIATLTALDAFLVVPSEALVITGGVFAVTGETTLLLVVLSAALGSFVGDHVSYTVGRFGGGRLRRRARPGSWLKAIFDWAEHNLRRRGGVILIAARFLPGGRTATTLTMGAVRYPRSRFSFFDAIAATSWAWYTTLLGVIGGVTFRDQPLLGVVLGLAVATVVAIGAEVSRRVQHRRSDGPASAA